VSGHLCAAHLVCDIETKRNKTKLLHVGQDSTRHALFRWREGCEDSKSHERHVERQEHPGSCQVAPVTDKHLADFPAGPRHAKVEEVVKLTILHAGICINATPISNQMRRSASTAATIMYTEPNRLTLETAGRCHPFARQCMNASSARMTAGHTVNMANPRSHGSTRDMAANPHTSIKTICTPQGASATHRATQRSASDGRKTTKAHRRTGRKNAVYAVHSAPRARRRKRVGPPSELGSSVPRNPRRTQGNCTTPLRHKGNRCGVR